MLEFTKEPTIIEKVPLCIKVVSAAQLFGVTTRIGHLGLCFARIEAVLPECVKARIRLAFRSYEDLTAQ